MFPSTYIIRLLPAAVNVSSIFRTRSQVSIAASASGLAAVQQGSELQTPSRDAGPRAPASRAEAVRLVRLSVEQQ